MNIENVKYFSELIKILNENGIKKNDICIVGSATLAYFEIRENKDIDIVIKKNIRLDKFNNLNTFSISKHIEVVRCGWLPNKKVSDDKLIDNSQFHIVDKKSGFKFVKPECVLAKKEAIRRDKDLPDINLLRDFFNKNNFDIKLYNISKNKFSFLQKIKNRLRPYYKKFQEKRLWNFCVGKDIITIQKLDKLLSYQYKKNKFNRYDIIVRYLAIEEFYGKNNIGFNLYKKMQEKRGYLKRIDHKDNKDSLEKFKELIKNIKTKGFDINSLVPVDRNQQLYDGSHRLACALYFNQNLIPLKIGKFEFNTDYSLDWFRKKGFSENEIQLIEAKKREIFYKKGIYFQVILWPPVQKYFNEIENDIKEKYEVLDSYEMNFYNENIFKEFVFGVYESDDIEKWKIEKKLTGFKEYDLKVKIIEIEIPNPKFRRKGLNNHDISTKVEQIKKEYRNKYKEKVDNYFYDIIMHIGDNFEHTREIDKVIKKFKKLI